MAEHNNTGLLGEQIAENYLRENGYTILHKNWRHKHWEVDFIVSKKDILHFIEVKTRRSRNFGMPEDNVTNKKMQHLLNAAEAFLYLHPVWKKIQFDILSISLLKNKSPEIFFIKDVSTQ